MSHPDRVKYGGFCEPSYLFYSLWLLSRSWSLIPTWPFETQSIKSLTTIHTVYILCPTQIGVNMGGCVILLIYIIVSDCCLGPETWSQLDHLKVIWRLMYEVWSLMVYDGVWMVFDSVWGCLDGVWQCQTPSRHVALAGALCAAVGALSASAGALSAAAGVLSAAAGAFNII